MIQPLVYGNLAGITGGPITPGVTAIQGLTGNCTGLQGVTGLQGLKGATGVVGPDACTGCLAGTYILSATGTQQAASITINQPAATGIGGVVTSVLTFY